MGYYYPEGYFGPVCDVYSAPTDPEDEPLTPAPPVLTECIVGFFCDPEEDPPYWGHPRWECELDDDGNYVKCYVINADPPETIGPPYTIPPEGDWPIESPVGHDLEEMFELPATTPEGCYPFDSDINIRPITIVKEDGSTVKRYARNKSTPVTYAVTSEEFWSNKGNAYAVWVNPEVCTLPCLEQTVTYSITIPTDDTYHFEFGCDDNGKVFIGEDLSITPLITKAGGMFKGGDLVAPGIGSVALTKGVNKVTVQVTNGNATEVVMWQHGRAQTQTTIVRKSTVGGNDIPSVGTYGRGEQESDTTNRAWYFSFLSESVAREYFSGRFGRTGTYPDRGRPPDIGMDTWINHYLGQAGTSVNDNPLLATQWTNTKAAMVLGYASESLLGDIVDWHRSSCSSSETYAGLAFSDSNTWAQDWATNPGGWYMRVCRGSSCAGVGLPRFIPFSDREYGESMITIDGNGNWTDYKLTIPGYDGDRWFASATTTTHTFSGFTVKVESIANGTQEDGSVKYDSEWWMEASPSPATLVVGQVFNTSFSAGGTDNINLKVVIEPGTETGNLGWFTSGPHSAWGSFMNTYAVWPSRTSTFSGTTKTLQYVIQIPETGNYNLEYAADNNMTIAIDGTALTLSPAPAYTGSSSITFAATKGQRILTMAVTNTAIAAPNTDTWQHNPAGGAWRLTRAGSSGNVVGTFDTNGNFVTTGTGTATVTFGFSWNDSQSSYGTALGTYSIPELSISFTQGNTQTGSLANQTATVEGGKTYTCSVVGGHSAGFGITNSNQNICFYDGNNTDCNATLTSSVSNIDMEVHNSANMKVPVDNNLVWHTRMASGYEYYEQAT